MMKYLNIVTFLEDCIIYLKQLSCSEGQLILARPSEHHMNQVMIQIKKSDTAQEVFSPKVYCSFDKGF